MRFAVRKDGTFNEAVVIDSSGNVGIGVTPFAHTLGTSASLDLKGNGGIWGYAGATYVNSNAYYDSGWKYKTTAPAAVLQVGGSSQELTFRQAVSGTAGNAITYTQPFTIDTSGNVGIGITAPVPKLHLAYSGGSYGTDATSGFINQADTGRATQRIRSITDNASELFFDVNGGIRWDISARGSSSNYNLHFYPQAPVPVYNNVSSHTFQLSQNGDVIVTGAGSSGKFGIGTTSPIAKLDVRNNDGNASGLHIVADFNQNGGAGAQMILGYYANGS